MFLTYRDAPATAADRDWVRRQLNQLAHEHHLPHDTYVQFHRAIERATWRREVQYLAEQL